MHQSRNLISPCILRHTSRNVVKSRKNYHENFSARATSYSDNRGILHALESSFSLTCRSDKRSAFESRSAVLIPPSRNSSKVAKSSTFALRSRTRREEIPSSQSRYKTPRKIVHHEWQQKHIYRFSTLCFQLACLLT